MGKRKGKQPASKTVRIAYGLFNNPNHSAINKAIERETAKGYRLVTRQDNPVGCLTLLFTLGWARGATELMFALDKAEGAA